MRIIGGEWRAHTIKAPEGRDTTRPTTDRVREAMASIVIAHEGGVDGLSVLDAFAGSGALGLEMLSRGAAKATFLEADKVVAAIIRANVEKLGAQGRARVICADAFAVCKRHGVAGAPFDVALIDPPYDVLTRDVRTMVQDALKAGLLASDCLILYQRSSKSEPLKAVGFTYLGMKAYGVTAVDLLRAGVEEEPSDPNTEGTDA